MANFQGHPAVYEFGKLTMTRGENNGRYVVTVEGREEPIGSVEPYGDSDWGWLHFETSRSGMVNELAAAGAGIWAIEQTREE